MSFSRRLSLVAIMLASGATVSWADGDAAAGKGFFNKCRACHEADREVNKVGPHLVAVFGRTAGTLESFAGKYSKAMVDAGAGGMTWDDANLAAYLKDPKGFIPGNKMAFAGIKTDSEIADLIAFLKANPKP